MGVRWPGGTRSAPPEAWLRAVLEQARVGVLPVPGEERAVLFTVAARELLRFVEEERACKPSTLRAYRSSAGTG